MSVFLIPLPGHSFVLHILVSDMGPSPEQSFPLPLGSGLSQFLSRCINPSPHSLSHFVQFFQGPKPPFTSSKTKRSLSKICKESGIEKGHDVQHPVAFLTCIFKSEMYQCTKYFVFLHLNFLYMVYWYNFLPLLTIRIGTSFVQRIIKYQGLVKEFNLSIAALRII